MAQHIVNDQMICHEEHKCVFHIQICLSWEQFAGRPISRWRNKNNVTKHPGWAQDGRKRYMRY